MSSNTDPCPICGREDCPHPRDISQAISVLNRIDQRSIENTYTLGTHTALINANSEVLKKISAAQLAYMSDIAVNTKAMADSMRDQASALTTNAAATVEVTKENKELVRIIAGKRQVPLSIFLVVLTIIGIIVGIILVYFTHVNLTVETNKVQINSSTETSPQNTTPIHKGE